VKTLMALAMILASATAAGSAELDERFDKDVLIVVASRHACYRFDIYLALSNEQRARGLMFVRDMPMTTGMLFVYEREHVVSMWMKNTYIPLDMVFARADGTIASVARRTEPLSLRSVASAEPVKYVLELNSGVTRRLHIDEDSLLVWDPARE
jgi:uncharacterized membrane protein (UPF0127 family)